MFYAYVLQSLSVPTELYRGHTSDLRQRLGEHNAGKCLHTSKFAPWKVKFYAAFETLELAQRFEQYLKSGSGHAFSQTPLRSVMVPRTHGQSRRLASFRFSSAENPCLSGTDTPATVLPAMSEAGNQFHAPDIKEAVELGKRFPIGGAFLIRSDKEG